MRSAPIQDLKDRIREAVEDIGGSHFAIWLWKISREGYYPVGVVVVVIWLMFSIINGIPSSL